MRLKDQLLRFSTWLIPQREAATKTPKVDTEYLKGDTVVYRWMSVLDAEHHERFVSDMVRCDVCGKLLPLEDMPAMVAHVGRHNEHGDAVVDPTEIPPRQQLPEGVDEWNIEHSQEAEPWEI